MLNCKLSLSSIAALTGAALVSTYIIFGGFFASKELPKKKIRKKGIFPGLANVGNTCFLNCILQALASCPSFMKWLDSNTFRTPPILLCALKKIIKVLNNENEDTVANAYDVLNALRSHGWVISAEEQDAHELFHALTSTIHDEIVLIRQQSNSLLNVSWFNLENDQTETNLTGNDCQEGKHVAQSCSPNDSSLQSTHCQSNSSFVYDYSKNCSFKSLLLIESPIDKIQKKPSVISKVPSSLKQCYYTMESTLPLESPFKGHLASQLKCSICGFKNAEQWNTFESISLSLPNSTRTSQNNSLIDLLDAFVRPECVTDVTCDYCSNVNGSPSQSAFSKRLTIGKLPECLCIHIQRTVWLENGCAVKRKDFVLIPEVLNMEPFTYSVLINDQQDLKGGLLGGRDALSTDVAPSTLNKSEIPLQILESFQASENNATRLRWRRHSFYKLQAVVVHVGDVFSGHFVTYRKGAVQTELKDRWFYTSDVTVQEVSLEEVLQSNAYMIIYERFEL